MENSLQDLVKYGFCRLPSIKKVVDETGVFEQLKNEIGDKTYAQNSNAQLEFIKKLGIHDLLPARLHEIAKSNFNYSGSLNNSYHIARLVRPGDQTEGYRGHFDGHLFTLVMPINIPTEGIKNNCGQLNFFPKLRRHPKNELENIFGKVRYKRYASEDGFIKLRGRCEYYIEDFLDYRPLLFIGTTTLHGNAPVDTSSIQPRLSFLSHYFDPSEYGISALLRKLRRR